MRLLFLFFFLGMSWGMTAAQDPLRFKDEVAKLENIPFDTARHVILFTGSSSIRNWKNIGDFFPDKKVINTGFGGSHMSDLLYYYESLILRFRPEQIFIYEGDNDIASDKSPQEILKDTKSLVGNIKKDLPKAEVVLISAKPSIARWEQREDFKKLNKLFAQFADETEGVEFADIWKVMLDDEGTPKKEIFTEDNLHMNEQGYDLWAEEISEFVE